jgi:hypothetical protein
MSCPFLITATMAARECGRLLGNFEIKPPLRYPTFYAEQRNDMHSDAVLFRIGIDGEFITARLNESDLTKSIDDFSRDILLPLVKKLPQWKRIAAKKHQLKKGSLRWKMRTRLAMRRLSNNQQVAD